MKYIITNLSTRDVFEYDYPRNIEQLRPWLVNSASTRSDIELFRNIAVYGIENFHIKTESKLEIKPEIENIKIEVEYKEIRNGEPVDSESKTDELKVNEPAVEVVKIEEPKEIKKLKKKTKNKRTYRVTKKKNA